jgi:hypothetical protein
MYMYDYVRIYIYVYNCIYFTIIYTYIAHILISVHGTIYICLSIRHPRHRPVGPRVEDRNENGAGPPFGGPGEVPWRIEGLVNPGCFHWFVGKTYGKTIIPQSAFL